MTEGVGPERRETRVPRDPRGADPRSGGDTVSREGRDGGGGRVTSVGRGSLSRDGVGVKGEVGRVLPKGLGQEPGRGGIEGWRRVDV